MTQNVGETAAQVTAHSLDLAPPDVHDPVVEAYKQDVDRTLLRENLMLSADERFAKFESYMQLFDELRAAGQRCLARQTEEAGR